VRRLLASEMTGNSKKAHQGANRTTVMTFAGVPQHFSNLRTCASLAVRILPGQTAGGYQLPEV
jgi:hypothetical protein